MVISYANALLLAQTAQLLNYQFLSTSFELDGCTVYQALQLRQEATASNLVYDEDGEQVTFEDDRDFGSCDTSEASHTSSLTTCGCHVAIL